MKRRLPIVILSLAASGLTGCALFFSDTYNSADYHGVHEVTLNGDQATMDDLLDAHPRLINVPDYDKNTLLHLAVLRNHPGEVKDLLSRGAKVNAVNTAKMAPIHIAAKQGERDVVVLLLSHHPNLALRDSRGWTPLTWAVKAHHDEVAKLLRNVASAR
jgi:ankyrin repeat protein